MGLFGDLADRGELEKKAKAEGRLPPGQSLTLKWPVLHPGSVPRFDAAKWDFKISGLDCRAFRDDRASIPSFFRLTNSLSGLSFPT